MPCNCEQGKCDCGGKVSRATVVVVVLICVAISAMSIGFYRLVSQNTGEDCEITLQFQDSKATYIGKTV
jgi:hypothetical protein